MNTIIYMPNEVFEDFRAAIQPSRHIAFSYCYYYYCSYLYRYCKYVTPQNGRVTQKDIKKALGYSANNLTVDYIIKKNGVLDQIGYTETVSDYPLLWSFEESGGELEFYTIDDLKGNPSYTDINSRNYKIKYPIKAFKRNKNDSFNTGTFFDIANTHGIEFPIFQSIINNRLLGSVGMYLYAYLKYKITVHNGSYQASQFMLHDATGVGTTTLKLILKRLEAEGLIYITHKNFDLNSEERQGNIYQLNKN
ncbi:hypothetical protein M2277_005098 [Paenibacillus sp. LBL]|uniref:hypothetical protein n=1 Tax=Paenibacillus sp. LBL TaxID=2940563 RepID=UPI00247553B5|nr:hypothetical protein [Paenibacillus sp. LBL]MDH6674406.1 hypothetical protein [Paenibacillus sp. LBL]